MPRDTRIVLDDDRYRRGLPENRRFGTIVKRVSMTCFISWDEDPDNHVRYDEGEVRYWVDTGKARLVPPRGRSLLEEKSSPSS